MNIEQKSLEALKGIQTWKENIAIAITSMGVPTTSNDSIEDYIFNIMNIQSAGGGGYQSGDRIPANKLQQPCPIETQNLFPKGYNLLNVECKDNLIIYSSTYNHHIGIFNTQTKSLEQFDGRVFILEDNLITYGTNTHIICRDIYTGQELFNKNLPELTNGVNIKNIQHIGDKYYLLFSGYNYATLLLFNGVDVETIDLGNLRYASDFKVVNNRCIINSQNYILIIDLNTKEIIKQFDYSNGTYGVSGGYRQQKILHVRDCFVINSNNNFVIIKADLTGEFVVKEGFYYCRFFECFNDTLLAADDNSFKLRTFNNPDDLINSNSVLRTVNGIALLGLKKVDDGYIGNTKTAIVKLNHNFDLEWQITNGIKEDTARDIYIENDVQGNKGAYFEYNNEYIGIRHSDYVKLSKTPEYTLL